MKWFLNVRIARSATLTQCSAGGISDSQSCVWKMPLSDPENTCCLKCGVGFHILWRVECCMSSAMHPGLLLLGNLELR